MKVQQTPIVPPLQTTTTPAVPPWAAPSSSRTRPTPSTIRDPPEYTYFMKRLEEKIMDRMKIQMDTLYQKIEDKMMTMQ